MWISPAFSRYDAVLAQAMTKWLYADPQSNPNWKDPAKWAGSGRIQFVSRTLVFPTIAAGGNLTQLFQLGGGRNTLVFGRTATVVPSVSFPVAPAVPPTLPNERASHTLITQTRTDGWIEIENQPIANCFGSGQWPFIPPIPEFWYGNSDRNILVTNNTNDVSTITLSWTVAMLDTGR